MMEFKQKEKKWKKEHKKDLERITELENSGHHLHCACRQVWGDGECECDLIKSGYDPYGWVKKA